MKEGRTFWVRREEMKDQRDQEMENKSEKLKKNSETFLFVWTED